MNSEILKKEIDIEELIKYIKKDINNKCLNCSYYNSNYSCPSFDFNIIDFLKNYSKCILYGKKFYTDEELLAFNLSDEVYYKLKNELLDKYKKEVNDGLKKIEEIVKDSNAILVSHCDICERCARIDGLNCYYSMMAHYSIDALNLDIEMILENEFSEKLDQKIEHKMNKYFILLGVILKK